MLNCGLRSEGRELSIKFTCHRCGCIKYVPYDQVMDNECCYLSQSKLPSGWYKLDFSRILCEDCADKFKQFMDG